jgi:uncharacterized protein YmfQ (DUF2313 family)
VSSHCVRVRLLQLCIAMSATITRVNCHVIGKNIAKRYKQRSERYNVVAGVSRTFMLRLKHSYLKVRRHVGCRLIVCGCGYHSNVSLCR